MKMPWQQTTTSSVIFWMSVLSTKPVTSVMAADGSCGNAATGAWMHTPYNEQDVDISCFGQEESLAVLDGRTRCGDRPSRLREAYLRLTTSATQYTAAQEEVAMAEDTRAI